MKKWILAAVLLLPWSGQAWGSIIYSIDRTVGDGWIRGTITTNGGLGNLVLYDCDHPVECLPGKSFITDWALTIFDGTGSFTLNRQNSGLWGHGKKPELNSTNFWATEQSLLYDFSSPGSARFRYGEDWSGGPYWGLTHPSNSDSDIGPSEGLYAGPHAYELPSEEYKEVFDERWQLEWRAPYEVIIGSAIASVPGPGSMALLAIGLAGLVGTRKLRN